MRKSLETWPASGTSSWSSQEKGALGKAPSPRSWPWPCAMQARRWGSWTWTCVAPASRACLGRRAGPCTSVTAAGHPSSWTGSRASRSCPWASCWRSRTRPWCGEAPRRMVTAGRPVRCPDRRSLIKQFVSDVAWGELDYLVVDTPPGTSDEHMAAIEALRPYQPLGALVVTTPQAVSVGDVRRELTFCRKTGVRVMGVVENMSGFTCPHCTECTSVFSRGGGEELARLAGVPFLGSVPLDPELTRSLEEGHDFIREFPGSPTFAALTSIARRILDATPTCLP
ncbi:cytosolic Fe-S cluster assembly factor NUBP2 isoform X2 [Macaca nemestrina]|uniref:cytosolic Fe-S cluster assembly factor NUBP2 isoform X2 n=1 Tax=Macaca nemestrina TaxID=9545 RepID=UPI0039B98C04